MTKASLLACLTIGFGGGARAETPTPLRVVSMNLCTDQLAMMIAAPDQLISVSYLAQDPRGSAMYKQARAYPINHGRAEEIFLLRPDLVIAGRFSTRTTVAMLERLGIPVVSMIPAYSLAAVRDRLAEMGQYLHREERAAELVAQFDVSLATLRSDNTRHPRAATYSQRGYTSGDKTLAGEIIMAAGFANVATELGLENGGTLALEQLVMSNPDILIGNHSYPGYSQAEERLQHPALVAFKQNLATGSIGDANWVCGTPHVLAAITRLKKTREMLEASQ